MTPRDRSQPPPTEPAFRNLAAEHLAALSTGDLVACLNAFDITFTLTDGALSADDRRSVLTDDAIQLLQDRRGEIADWIEGHNGRGESMPKSCIVNQLSQDDLGAFQNWAAFCQGLSTREVNDVVAIDLDGPDAAAAKRLLAEWRRWRGAPMEPGG